MTKEQYTALLPYGGKFDTVKRTGYVHITRNEFKDILAVYEQVFGETLKATERNCPRCIVRAMNRLADEYIKYRDKLEKKNKKKNDE